MNTEAIVNTANDNPSVGTGCDSAVYKAAGYDELLSYRKEKIGFVPEGDAFITPGFNLQSNYIIHAVSPMYLGGDEGEEEKLRSCYRKSLQLAKDNGIRSIAFPLIATGGFGYPKEEGMRIAVDEIHSFLLRNDMDIFLVVFDSTATALGERIYPDLEAYIDRNYVKEKREEEYGEVYFGSVGSGDSVYDEYRVAGHQLEKRRGKPASKKSIFGMASAMLPAAKESAPIEEDEDVLYPEAASFDEERDVGILDERMQHLSDTFSQYLMFLIKEKGLKNADVYKRAIVDKKIFSKIKNNPDHHPQKITALCLCIGAKLNLDESKDLLARAGYALSPCDKTDIIFSYFIENEIYDMIELDIQLEEHGLPCIIS
ncbi:MAG: macro domain-containing protein [Lachnospiraceae bacterium]|nr:macro domain-containing protein [Lachnospiraceae bacterium]